MVHITVSLDQDVYERAHRRATKLGTSVEGLVRGYLRSVAEGAVAEPRIEEVEQRSGKSDEWEKTGSGVRSSASPQGFGRSFS